MDIVSRLKSFFKKLSCRKTLIAFCGVSTVLFALLFMLELKLSASYKNLESIVINDRNGYVIAVKPNSKGNYAVYSNSLPERFKDLLLKKEDKFFYAHLGINPVSTWRAFVTYLKTGNPGASSTITQQLVKNLLGNEQDRTINNKLFELIGTFSLELFKSKETILTMYGNTVYMGNQIQGFNQAAEAYFGKNLSELNDTESLSLIATVSGPSGLNPWKNSNKQEVQKLSASLNVPVDLESFLVKKRFRAISDSDFEFESVSQCLESCSVTLDKPLSDSLREILSRNITETSKYGGRNGAIVVIKLPENELLAIVGTTNVGSDLPGSAINMAIEARPIGSTIKPFIYLKAFEKGLRPYTTVEDREYKFPIASGFPLYPKNYDGAYRGTVTLHEALSNSLNVPTVKTLEFITLPEFYSFLEQGLRFKALQPMDSYQYGIALGGLEMTPLTLAHLATVFPNNGLLKPLKLFPSVSTGGSIIPPMETGSAEKRIADESYIELVNKVISDRLSGVEQFGLAGNLNLSQANYAVKTGTSRDFHDTWTVGFTPDFLVAVWLGNVENEPMRQVTSTSGAGKIWHDSMEFMINTTYNKKTPFDFSKITAYQINNREEYGLPDDNVETIRSLLSEKSLILNPHEADTFSFEVGMGISFRSSMDARWYVNGDFLGAGTNILYTPKSVGKFVIRALSQEKEETVTIRVVDN